MKRSRTMPKATNHRFPLYAQAAKQGISRNALRRNIAQSIISQKVQQQAVMQHHA